MPYRTTTLMIAAAVLLSLCAGCAASTPVEDAPLAEERQKKLHQTLVGTWEHTHIVDKKGNREPVETATITWSFKEDGTGAYHQKVPSMSMNKMNSFHWHLEGRNIVLELDKGGRKTYYRAESWSPQQMRWFNYTQSNHYVVRKQ